MSRTRNTAGRNSAIAKHLESNGFRYVQRGQAKLGGWEKSITSCEVVHQLRFLPTPCPRNDEWWAEYTTKHDDWSAGVGFLPTFRTWPQVFKFISALGFTGSLDP